MFDCANVEMRELLPELVAGSLDASTRARVEAHLVDCADCATEVETLRLVRASFASAPSVDTRRIVAALPTPSPAPAVGKGGTSPRRWVDWRLAAALTMVTVGGLSIAINGRRPTGVPPTVIDSVPTPPVAPPGGGVEERLPSDSGRPDTVKGGPVVPLATSRPQPVKAQLALGRGSDELDDAAIKALLGALDEIDRGPVAPSAEPDRSPVLPVIKEGER